MTEVLNIWNQAWDSTCPKCHSTLVQPAPEIRLCVIQQFTTEDIYLCLMCQTILRVHNLELLDGRRIEEPFSDAHIESKDREFTSADFGFLSDRQFVRSVERAFLSLLNGIKELKAVYNIEVDIFDVARNEFIAKLLNDLARRFGIDRAALNAELQQQQEDHPEEQQL